MMQSTRRATPFWRDTRFWAAAIQVIFVAALMAAGWLLWSQATRNLARVGLAVQFGFLRHEAAFAIGEALIPYTPADSYGRAFLVGAANTLRVAFFGIILASLLGLTMGIARLSGNWLVRQVSGLYVEVVRNTPLLVQLFVWYFAVLLKLPRIQEAVVWPGPIYLSNRGVAIPWFQRSPTFGWWLLVLAAGVALAVWVQRTLTRRAVETGRRTYAGLWAAAIALGAAVAGWMAMPAAPAALTLPRLESSRFVGGAVLTPEFAALLVGLTVYTGAFIAEIVRGGILAVAKGQWEAARALGLRPWLVLRLVVLPQALRVIIPPLTSQYLNLTKNSSLAILIGYPDLVSIGQTVFNQTGRVIEVILLLMGTYLTFSLITSLVMNLYNRAVRLVER